MIKNTLTILRHVLGIRTPRDRCACGAGRREHPGRTQAVLPDPVRLGPGLAMTYAYTTAKDHLAASIVLGMRA